MPRLTLISDTHLGAAPRDVHNANFDAVVAYLNATNPDLVINCGDLSFHGRMRGDDLDLALEAHARVRPQVRFIPGNHDTGDCGPNPYGGWGIDEARCAAYRARFGQDWWQQELGDWRVLGLNAQLMGSGLPAETEQRDWLAQALSDPAQPTLIAIHKPAVFARDDGIEYGLSAVAAPDRAAFMDLVAPKGHGPRIVCSGHVHEYFARETEGIQVIGVPSTASVHGTVPRHGGTLALGLIELSLEGDRVTSRFVTPEGMTHFDIQTQLDVYNALKTTEPAP